MKKIVLSLALIVSILTFCPHRSGAVVTNQAVQTISALGNGSTTAYTPSFDFRDNSQLAVYLRETSSGSNVDTLLVAGSGATNYTLNANPATTVTLGTAPSSTQRVVMLRTLPLTQPVAYDSASAFPASDHETQMDEMVMMLQDLSATVTNIGASTLPILTSGQVYVGNSSNIASPVSVTGDISINTSGVVTIGPSAVTYGKLSIGGSLVNADINASAAIARTKIGSSTVNSVVLNDSSGNFAALTGITSGDYVRYNASTSTWGRSTITAPNVQIFTSGSGTYTTPTSPRPLYLIVTMVGGGGGGGSGGNGGVGAAGAAGGNTTFGPASATGGAGGPAGTSVAGSGGSLGAGPTGIVVTGGGGSGGGYGVYPTGGYGGNSLFGGSGGGGNNAIGSAATSGAVNTGSGGGGGGGGSSAGSVSGSGGSASGGIQAIIVSPLATYSYAVGAGGVGKTGGTGSFGDGADGGSGQIRVDAIYQ